MLYDTHKEKFFYTLRGYTMLYYTQGRYFYCEARGQSSLLT